MSSLRATVIGHLGRDIEMRFTGDGKPVGNFSIGVTPYQRDKDAEKKTTWVRCSIWGTRATAIAPMMRTGTMVAVFGELDLKEYADKEGNLKSGLELRVTDVDILSSKKDAAKEYVERVEAADSF